MTDEIRKTAERLSNRVGTYLAFVILEDGTLKCMGDYIHRDLALNAVSDEPHVIMGVGAITSISYE